MKTHNRGVSNGKSKKNSTGTSNRKIKINKEDELPSSKLESKLNRQYDRHLKILAALSILLCLLVFLSMLSYTAKDELCTELSFSEILGILRGDAIVRAKVETVYNWLGVIGAIVSNTLYNSTIGYAIIFLPFILMLWAKNLFFRKAVTEKIIRLTILYMIFGTLFAAIMGTLQRSGWFMSIPKEWSGSLGYFLSSITTTLIGSIGSLFVLLAIVAVVLIYGINIRSQKLKDVFLLLYNSIFNWLKKIYLKLKDAFTKEKEKPADIIPDTPAEVDQPSHRDELMDTDEPARIIKSNLSYQAAQAMPQQYKMNNVSIFGENSDSLDKYEVHSANEDIAAMTPTASPFNSGNDVISKISSSANENESASNSFSVPEEQKPRFEPRIIVPVIEKIIIEESQDEPANEIAQPANPMPEANAEFTFNKTASDVAILNSNEVVSIPLNDSTIQQNQPWQENIQNQSVSASSFSPVAPLTAAAETFAGTALSVVAEKEPVGVLALAESGMIAHPLISSQQNVNIDKSNSAFAPINPLSTGILDEKIDFKFPPVELLAEESTENLVDDNELRSNARILQDKLETFKIFIENLSVTPGPVVTQYEFVPAPGIKVSKIESFADDMAMALKARGIRIIAPIPGRGTIGVEIPNQKPVLVRFGSIVKSVKFQTTQHKLPIALGKTISGEVFCADLTKMPHLLIAGSTGSGKSVGINTLIASLLYKIHPRNLKFVIVDPKKVELRQYAALESHYLAISPDLESSIITDSVDAVIALKAVCAEMDLRYDILARSGQRNILEYNAKVAEGKFKEDKEIEHKQMPYIVVIIDELADLMMTASKEVEGPIIRLAQLARAVGIHCVVATQRPSVDVITGIIKANFPARIAYLVASKVDSRTILDGSGAEQLLGNGDMLFSAGGAPKPIRIQNAYVSTDEVEAICEFIGKQEGYSEPYSLPSLIEKKDKLGISREDRDPLFEDAARILIQHQQGSVSLIQRRLKVGYARAGRIIDELEAAGVVGPYDGSKARQVYMESESELEAVL